MRLFLLLLACAVALPGCSKQCRLMVEHTLTEPADLELTSVQVRLEGTSVWGGADLLEERVLPAGTRRAIRLDETYPYALDVRASDRLGRTWTVHDAVVCDAPDERLEVVFTDADRDVPCVWSLVNGTGTALAAVRMRRSGAGVWARALVDAGLALDDGASVALTVDDDPALHDIQGEGADGALWTAFELGPCDAGAALEVTLAGPADAVD